MEMSAFVRKIQIFLLVGAQVPRASRTWDRTSGQLRDSRKNTRKCPLLSAKSKILPAAGEMPNPLSHVIEKSVA